MIDSYTQLLKEFVAFKSISTSDAFKDDIVQTANWLKDQCEAHGFVVEIIEGYGNPLVFATYQADPLLDTCLVYGHYDVQPAEVSDGWDSEPFELTQRDNRLYARGVVDNKGQLLIHLVTIFELIQTKQLGFNITLLIEGDEETGSGDMQGFIEEHREKLKADFALISDGEIASYPVIEAGFRGGFNATVTLTTADTDVHSGAMSVVPSAAHELGKLIAGLHDHDNRITIKGFYDDVDDVEEAVLEAHKQIPFDIEEYKKLTGAQATLTEPGHDIYTQIGLRPTIQVTGMDTGYTGDGYRNSIPKTATAKMNVRLVEEQDPAKVIEQFKKHLEETLPEYVSYTLESVGEHVGVKLRFDNAYTEKVESMLEQTHGSKPIRQFCGGAIPVITFFYKLLGIPTFSVPLGNDDCRMHAPNENFNIDFVKRGLDFSKAFFTK